MVASMNSFKTSILLSIKPEFVDLIFSGEKTVELRKAIPKNLSNNDEIIIYASSPTKSIVGKAKIKKVAQHSPNTLWKKVGAKTGISFTHFKNYFKNKSTAYGIFLEDIERFSTSIPLNTLRKEINFTPPQSYMYTSDALLKVLAQ